MCVYFASQNVFFIICSLSVPVWYLMGIHFEYTRFISRNGCSRILHAMSVCFCVSARVWLIIQVICSENEFYYYQFKISHCQSHTVHSLHIYVSDSINGHRFYVGNALEFVVFICSISVLVGFIFSASLIISNMLSLSLSHTSLSLKFDWSAVCFFLCSYVKISI